MKPIKVRAHYEHPISRWSIAAEIDDPWHKGDYFLYRLPEIFAFAGKPYLSQPKGDRCWSGVQPEAAPEWSIDADERETGYHIKFYDGVELGVEVKAGDRRVDFKYNIINNSTKAGIPNTCSCFMLWTSPSFIDRGHSRTFVWVGGKPVPIKELSPKPETLKRWSWIRIGVKRPAPKDIMGGWASDETVDHGLVAVKNVLNNYWLGLAWTNASWIMARSTIPCLHSEPSYATISSGNTGRVTGRLYFHEGTLDELENIFLHDEERCSQPQAT